MDTRRDILGLLFFFLSTVVRGHVLSLYTTGASFDGVGWLVGWCVFSGLQQVPRRSRPSVGVIHRRQKTGRLDKDYFLGRRPVLNRNAHLPSAEGCCRLSSNQRQSHPQKTVRLDKDAFLGRRPVFNRTHVSRQRLEDAKTLVEPGLQSSNQRQSHPQKTVRLDKDASLAGDPC